MLNFIIDIFCKDTTVGLCAFENNAEKQQKEIIKKRSSSKKKYLKEPEIKLDNHFIGPMIYHL